MAAMVANLFFQAVGERLEPVVTTSAWHGAHCCRCLRCMVVQSLSGATAAVDLSFPACGHGLGGNETVACGGSWCRRPGPEFAVTLDFNVGTDFRPSWTSFIHFRILCVYLSVVCKRVSVSVLRKSAPSAFV